MKKAKKVLALALSMLMIMSMFVIAPMSASAESSRLDNWQGNITTVLNVKGSGDSTRSDVQADGYYLTVNDTELYVGDSIVANGEWLNYSLNYTNAAGEAVSGTPNGNGQWYCNGNWKFDSQLAYGKINSGTNNPRTFDTAGTWSLKIPLDSGDTITLIELEVKKISRINNWQGAENVTLSFSSWDKSTGSYLSVNSDEIYTGDTLSYSSTWLNSSFTYENVGGETVTGKLSGNVIWYCNGAQVLSSQLYYGHINGTSDTPATLSVAGTWTASGTMSDGTVVTLAEFVVNQKPRAITNLEGTVFYDGAIDVSVYQADGVPFSTEDLYVGDKLVNGSGWWQNTGIALEIDGASYTGRITWLRITDPNGNEATGYHVYNGGEIDYVLKTAGTYTLRAKVENLKDAEGNDCGSKEPVTLRTFTVKECPHSYEFTETVAPACTTKGYDLYTCTYCGDATKVNLVDALGHNLTYADGVVTCTDCDYTKEYTGEAVSFGYKVADTTGASSYTTLEPAYFVGDTVSNTNGQWWKDYTFTYGDTSGTVYNAWLVKGDLEYFNEYREKRLTNGSYSDPNVTYIQVGYGNAGTYTFNEAGTYTLVGALQYDETSSFLTNIIPFALAEIEVFDAPETVSGDINGDGDITSLDLLVLQQHILNITTLDKTAAADLNKDGKVDAADITILQLKIIDL